MRAYYQIKELSQHYDIYLISLTDHTITEDDKNQLKPYCQSIDIQMLTINQSYINMIADPFSSLPWQVRYFYDRRIARHIHMMVEEIEPDHIYTQLIRMAPYVLELSDQKSIDYMDSMDLNMVSGGIAQFKRIPFFNMIEQKRCVRYERDIYEKFQYHFAISHRDRRSFDSEINEGITVSSNGVDFDFFQFRESIESEFDAAFIGNLGYIHNDRAAHYLIDEIMPLMTDDYNVLIAGSRPSDWLNIKQQRNVRVEGHVDDIREHYAKAKILVAPIFSGSGQQNKILEAMAQGIPCITTSFVNDSIGAEPGVEILIADSPKRFAGDMLALKTDRDLYKRLSYAGRMMVEERFGWEQAVAPIIEVIKS